MDKRLLFSAIDHKAAGNKDRVAISSPDGALTYSDLILHSDQVARQLAGQGLKKGQVVAVFLPKCAAYVIAILGINKAGGVFMPVETGNPAEYIEGLLSLVQPAFILSESQYAGKLISFHSSLKGTSILYIDNNTFHISNSSGQRLPQAEPQVVLTLPEGDDSCYLIYTSGSTGVPKIIEGVHKSLSHFIHWEVKEFDLKEDCRIGLVAPLTFDVSLRDIFAPLLAGGTLYIPAGNIQLEMKGFLNWIRDSSLTLLHIVPSVFRLLMGALRQVEDPHLFIGSLRHILLAGEPLYGRDVLAWRELAGESTGLVNLYGPSETTLAKLFCRIGPGEVHAESMMPLGIPLPNTTIAIISNGRLCDVGDTGEIFIKTPFRSKGYYKDPAQTDSRFIQNPIHNDFEDIVYRTGDWGKYLPDKMIAFAGRSDSQVKIRGNRVEIGQVEKCILGYPGIKECVVLAIESRERDLSLCCYFTEERKLSADLLKEYMKSRLPEYMIPAYFVPLETFPLNLNGKINKKALPKPEEMLYEQLSYEAPANKLEETLASIWSETLGLRRVGVGNSFFELGGHSLIATRIVSAVTYKLNRDLSLKEFFDNLTIRKLASLLAAKAESRFENIPVDETSQVFREVSFGQKRMMILTSKVEEKNLYNMPLAFTIHGKLDVTVFKEVFDLLIRRHESLRTTFHEVEGEIKQRIHETIPFRIIESQADPIHEAEITRRLMEEGMNSSFDLQNGPLLSGRLVKLQPDKFLFFFNIHHIVSDGWSMGILFREFVRLYDQKISGQEPSLPPLPIQYKDYVAWLKKSLNTPRFLESKRFWHTALGNIPASSAVVTDFPKTPSTGHQGAKHIFHFPVAESEQIRHICLQQEVSLHVFLLSVIYILLFKRNGLDQVVIGTPVAGRDHPDLHGLIGMFLNNVVLKIGIVPDEPFESFLGRVKSLAFEAYDHQEYPYDLLAEQLLPASSGWENPFYNVLVVMNNKGLMGENEQLYWLGETIRIESLMLEEEFSKLDLSFFCYDTPEISIAIEYNTGLFRKDTLVRMEADLSELVCSILQQKDITVYDLVNRISGAEEREMKEQLTAHNIREIEESF